MALTLNNNCWCKDIEVPKELISLIPEEYKNKSCICKNCIMKFKKDKIFFIQNLS